MLLNLVNRIFSLCFVLVSGLLSRPLSSSTTDVCSIQQLDQSCTSLRVAFASAPPRASIHFISAQDAVTVAGKKFDLTRNCLCVMQIEGVSRWLHAMKPSGSNHTRIFHECITSVEYSHIQVTCRS